MAAMAVVPLPMNGSNTIRALVDEMIRFIRSTGNGAGCELFISCVNSQTSPAALALGANLNLGLAIMYMTS